MEDFWQSYKWIIIYVGIVLLAVIILRILTNVLHRWLLKKEQQRFPEEQPKSVYWVRRILNALWLVLGLMAISFIFVDESIHTSLKGDFKLVFYLGILSVVTIVCASSVNMWFRKSIHRKQTANEDATSFKFLRYVAVIGIYFIGALFFLLAFPAFRGVAQTALGGAGVVAIIAGVASQEALSNLVGGIFIISFKPFRIGDTIQVTDSMVGVVADITLRHTVIRNFDNRMIVIPNAIINKERLINYDLGEKKSCERLEINISLKSNVELAKKIMQEECEQHPLIYDNRTLAEKERGAPVVQTALTRINEYSVTVRAWAWSEKFFDSFDLRIDVLESIKKRFEEEGVEIPYPSRTIAMESEREELERLRAKR